MRRARLHLLQLRAHALLAPVVERRQVGALAVDLRQVHAVLLLQAHRGVGAALRVRAHVGGVEAVLVAQAQRLAVQEDVVLQHLVHALLVGVQLLGEQPVLAQQVLRALRQLRLGGVGAVCRPAPALLFGRHEPRPGAEGRVRARPQPAPRPALLLRSPKTV